MAQVVRRDAIAKTEQRVASLFGILHDQASGVAAAPMTHVNELTADLARLVDDAQMRLSPALRERLTAAEGDSRV